MNDKTENYKAWVYDNKLKAKAGGAKSRFRHLKKHNIYGSSQQTPEQFTSFVNAHTQVPIVVFDLRQESHLVLNNSIPITLWQYKDNANEGLDPAEVAKLDIALTESLAKQEHIEIRDTVAYKDDKVPAPTGDLIKINSLQTWGDFVTSTGAIYKRFPITDHQKPTDEVVDMLVDAFRSAEAIRMVNPDTTFLVHCRGGRGRTSTIMTLMSMVFDTEGTSLENLLQEQIDLGGIKLKKDVSETTEDEEWKEDAKEGRSKFVADFYEYINDNEYGYRAGNNWTTWKSQKELVQQEINNQYIDLVQTIRDTIKASKLAIDKSRKLYESGSLPVDIDWMIKYKYQANKICIELNLLINRLNSIICSPTNSSATVDSQTRNILKLATLVLSLARSCYKIITDANTYLQVYIDVAIARQHQPQITIQHDLLRKAAHLNMKAALKSFNLIQDRFELKSLKRRTT